MFYLRICQIAHDIDIVCRKVERDANIANTGRKWTQSPGVQVKHLTKFTGDKVSLHLNDRRVKAFDVPNSQLGTPGGCELNERLRFLNTARHWLFEQHVVPLVKQIRSYLKMQVGGYNYCDKIRMCLLNHVAIIGEARNVKPADSMLQIWFIRFRNPDQLYLILVEISKYSKVIHSH